MTQGEKMQNGSPKVGVLVVGHGGLGSGFVQAVYEIMGEIPFFSGLDLPPEGKVSSELLEKAVQEVDPGGGVLIFTDLFGGTPTNLAIPLLRQERREVVCGVNLPMLLHILTLRSQKNLFELSQEAIEFGKAQILRPRDLLFKNRS
jgi:PTS system mannose-specific IIA component